MKDILRNVDDWICQAFVLQIFECLELPSSVCMCIALCKNANGIFKSNDTTYSDVEMPQVLFHVGRAFEVL